MARSSQNHSPSTSASECGSTNDIPGKGAKSERLKVIKCSTGDSCTRGRSPSVVDGVASDGEVRQAGPVLMAGGPTSELSLTFGWRQVPWNVALGHRAQLCTNEPHQLLLLLQSHFLSPRLHCCPLP